MQRTRSSVLGVVGLASLMAIFAGGCADGSDSGRTGVSASNASAGAMGRPSGQPASAAPQQGGAPGSNTAATGSATTPATTPTPAPSTPIKDAQGMASNASNDPTSNSPTEIAMFGAGCFWGVQSKFDKMPGVIETAVGYAGGSVPNPTYKQVCTDETGHAEVVHITFDPTKISYQQLVDAFFTLHDPTQLNRQGPDYGSQYRTVIFYYSPAQQTTAQETIQRLGAAKKFARPIVTQVVPAAEFWRGEEYHQKYLKKRGLDDCSL